MDDIPGMLLNADMSRRVVIDTEQAPWIDTPLSVVQRRMLERDGDGFYPQGTWLRNPGQLACAAHPRGLHLLHEDRPPGTRNDQRERSRTPAATRRAGG